jgi:queuine/archaeosine tRNA-ribosyltransferase
VAVLVDNVEPPIGLCWTARVSLIGWKGQREGEDLTSLTSKIGLMKNTVKKFVRQSEDLVLNTRRLRHPAFIFSVSSFETQISPAKTLELLNTFPPAAVLASAYDVLGMADGSTDVTPSDEVLKQLESKNTVIFLDSGNYEAHRFENSWWPRNPWLLKEAANRLRCDVVFSHDKLVDVPSATSANQEQLVEQVLSEVARDEKNLSGAAVSPIVHAPRLPDRSYVSFFLPEVCFHVAKTKRPPLIAVAERELGDGILERARRVRSIRRALNRLDFFQPLHILGTGNPLSMLILAFAGGDVFDGLEWCRTVVDGGTMRLHHFHHFDLFASQRSRIADELLREYLENKDEILTAKAKAVLHNLYFFSQFVAELQQAHQQDAYKEMFDRYLPGEFSRVAKRIDVDANE